MISETKTDDTFLHSQFFIEGFSTPYRLDSDSNSGGILLYVREDIHSNLTVIQNKPLESFFVELNLRNDKWLMNCSYNPHKNLIDNHLDPISKYLDLYSSKYEKVLILGNFNADIKEKHMRCFCDNYHLKSLIKQPTCYKNPDNPTCIDLLLTNAPRSFQIGLSDFHLMTLTVMRKSFKKLQPRIINYRSYKNLSKEKFKSSLLN